MSRKLSRSNDPRALRSRDALRQALLDMIVERPLEQILIREITERAGVSYPTFFSNYGSKDDLFANIATDEIRSLTQLMIENLDANDTSIAANAVCDHVEARRPVWTSLLTYGAASVMREEFLREASEFVKAHGLINPGIPGELTAAIAFSGLFEVLTWWLQQPVDYPRTRIAQYLALLVLVPTTRGHRID